MTTAVWTAVPNQGDEPDPDRDREVAAEQPEQVDPAGESERDREQDVRPQWPSDT
jgi:hypothetical protein